MPAGKRCRRCAFTAVGLVIAVAGAAGCAGYNTPNISGVESAVRNDPCVEWVDFTAQGGINITSGWGGTVGIKPDCTAAQLTKTVMIMAGPNAPAGLGGGTFLVTPHEPTNTYHSPDGGTYFLLTNHPDIAGFGFTVDDYTSSDLQAPTRATFARALDHWMSVRHLDPHARLALNAAHPVQNPNQPSLSKPVDEEIGVSLADGTSALALIASPPAWLAEAYWHVQIPDNVVATGGYGGTYSRPVGTMPSPTALRLADAMRSDGPLSESETVGVVVTGPSLTESPKSEFPYQRLEQTVIIQPSTLQSEAVGMPGPGAKKQIEATIDELDAHGMPFLLTIAYANVGSHSPFDPTATRGVGGAVLASWDCSAVTSPGLDPNPLTTFMYDYWRSPDRARSATSTAASSGACGS